MSPACFCNIDHAHSCVHPCCTHQYLHANTNHHVNCYYNKRPANDNVQRELKSLDTIFFITSKLCCYKNRGWVILGRKGLTDVCQILMQSERDMGLSYAKEIMSISSAVWAQCMNVTDTDKPCNDILSYMHTLSLTLYIAFVLSHILSSHL